MKTVRDSAKLTWTVAFITVVAILVRHWYLVSDVDYFDMVKAFLQTRDQVGRVHMFLLMATFWVSVATAIVRAALTEKYGFNTLTAAWIPLAVMCCLAVLFIPGIGLTNIHLFWLICYGVTTIGAWLSAHWARRFCVENSNFSEIKKDSTTTPELKVNRIDFIVAMLLTCLSYILVGLAAIGVLVFGIGNRGLIAGTDDITPVIESVRYEIATRFMDDGEYEKAMVEFRELGGYQDSQIMSKRCEDLLYRPTYLNAVGLMEQGQYDEARSMFWDIYDFEDSAAKIEQCDDLQYGPQYSEAVAMIGEERYEEALEIFEMLYYDVGYIESTEEINQCRGNIKASLAGTWYGDADSVLTLRPDLTCDYVDGGGSTGSGTWDVVDGRLFVQTSAFSYQLYGDLDEGYLTTSVLIKADSSSWRDETFTK